MTKNLRSLGLNDAARVDQVSQAYVRDGHFRGGRRDVDVHVPAYISADCGQNLIIYASYNRS